MTKDNFNKAKDLLEQIENLKTIKSKIHVQYAQSEDSALKVLLSECNDVCQALKEIKEQRFEDL